MGHFKGIRGEQEGWIIGVDMFERYILIIFSDFQWCHVNAVGRNGNAGRTNSPYGVKNAKAGRL